MSEELPEIVPFTSSQKELWLSSQTSLSEYSEVAIRVCFPVNNAVLPDRLQESIKIVLRRTPLLKASSCLDENEPHFKIGAGNDLDFRYIDVRNEPDPERFTQQFIHNFLEESVETQLIRYALIRKAESESLLVVKGSHLVIDGLGMFFHVAYIADIYSALTHNVEPVLGDICSCEEQYLQDVAHINSSRFGKDMAFWEEHLSRLPEKRIFRALPGHADVLGRTRFKKYYLSQAASRNIESLLAKYATSPAVYFTALHALIVSFMCDEKDIVIQTPVAFGERKSYKKRQGAQIATPPIFVELRQHVSFERLLEEIATQSKHFFRHIRTPHQWAMRKLGHKNLSFINDTFINYLSNPPKGFPDFQITSTDQLHSEQEAILFGALVLEEIETQQFSLTVRSSRNHLSVQDVERYVLRVEQLTNQLAAGLDVPQLDYILEEEREELFTWQQGVKRDYAIQSMPELFDGKVREFAQCPAVRDESGAVRSYAEVQSNSMRCAAWLTARGVKKGDIVAVLAKRTINLAEIILGIMRCGAVYLPIDPKSPAERIEFIVNDAKAVMTIDLGDAGYLTGSCDGAFMPPDPRDGAYLIYTSGSTGRPKGVLVPHSGFVNMIQGQIEVFGVGGSDHVLQFAPPIFDASLSEIFMSFYAGACLYPVSDKLRNEPWTLRQYMADNAISVTTFPPSYLHLFDKEAFPGLRVLITAGEPPVAEDALHYARTLQYFNAYGPTETCVCASIKRVSSVEALPISSGSLIPNATASIFNSEMTALPAGMVGELWVGGASVALGYYGNSELTKQRFQPLPGENGPIAYATGDLALWSAGGEIVLVGRADDQVKIRGNRVELGEVSFLLESCAGVRQAFALAAEDATGQPMLAAFMVLRPEASLETVISWSKDNLPAYMIPSFWHVLDAMPVSVTGKIDRNALKHIVKNQSRHSTGEQKVDRRLLDLCEQVLGTTYDPAASFFVQGGNSLNAMILLHEIRKVFSVDIAFRHFVTCDNLYEVESLLQERMPNQTAKRDDAIPLSRNQFQLWAYQQANDQSIDYNMPFLVKVQGAKAEAFIESFQQAVNDQELFSCTVAGDIDAPHFKKHELLVIPLHSTKFPSQESAETYFEKLIHTPFDLRNEPPVRLEIARLADGFLMLVLVHHIAGDGESLEILLRNTVRYLHNENSAKGVLATQSAFCRRENEYLRSSEFAADKAYWEKKLALPMPPVNPSQMRKGAMASIAIPPQLAANIELLAQQSGTSVLSCFVTLLADFLCNRHGREEMFIGVPVGLRETQDEFLTTGFFVNTITLRIARCESQEIASSVKATAAQLKESIAHSRYCNTAFVPEFLATHAHSGAIEEQGLVITRLTPQFRASKLSGSFTFETGEDARIILEYDEGFIPNGSSVLEELIASMDRACAESPQRSPLQVLSAAWYEILHSTFDETSEFFKDGGDSIKAIQITGILHRNGVTALTAADFLRSPKFADLSGLLKRAGTSQSGAGVSYTPVAGGQRVPLLPIQHALMQAHPDHWKTFYMLLPMAISAHITREKVEAWLRTLPERYEALRLSFTSEGAVLLYEPQMIVLKNRSFGAGTGQIDMFREMARLILADLDPEAGNTLGAGLAEREGKRYLVLAGHHLVLDTFSLDILRQDLLNFCHAVGGINEAFGMATRAVELEKLVAGGTFPTPEDRRFWQSVCSTPVTALDAVLSGRKDLASERMLTVKQLEGYRPEYSQSALSDLVSSLSKALYELGQREPILVTLESHGRDDLLPGLDMSQSLGWFTAICPMPLRPAPSCDDAQTDVLPWIRDIFTPRNCNAYGYLKKQNPQQFGFDSQIGINYFGQLSAGTEGDATSLLSVASPGNIPELLHPDFEPDSPLDLVMFFDESGVLHLGAYFSAHVLPAEWVAGLLENWTETLKTLPAYSQVLPQDVQARIRVVCNCVKGDIENIVLPDINHEPMLYQYLSADNGVYTQQIELYFKGQIDDFLLMKAWNTVVARHESLRSLFPMPYDGEFYRVVLHKARMSGEYHDFSHLPEHVAQADRDALLQSQRRRGFDLNKGPLLRTQFFRFDSSTFMVSWCFHHLLMDGWCIGILLRELFAAYDFLAGRSSVPLPAPAALTNYTRWRSRFDALSARQYWHSLLDGFTPLTGIAKEGAFSDAVGPDVDPETAELTLDTALTGTLQSVAASRSVTLPILVQALWAILLSTENGSCRDVVYGVVTSGRPPEVVGIDQTVGLFVQTLPLRARWSEEGSFEHLLFAVKEQSLQQMQHGHLPLSVIGRDLLDHLLVFENYPFESLFAEGRLELQHVHGYEKIPYPLGISVIPGKTLTFRFLYDPSRMERAEILQLIGKLDVLLHAVCVEADVSCLELENRLREAERPTTRMTHEARNTPFMLMEKTPAGDRGRRIAGAAECISDGTIAPCSRADFSNEQVGAKGPAGSAVSVENVLTGIYESVLHCKLTSIDADFFQLGGHSLLAMRVMAQISKQLAVRIGIDDILAHSSVRTLAAFIRSATAPAVSIPRVLPKDRYPLSASQKRIWFLQRLHEDSRVYQIPFVARMQVSVDYDVLQQALSLLEARHDAFRLRISADKPEQILAPLGSLKLEYHDAPHTQAALDSTAMAFGFDTPLVRVALFRQASSDYVILLCFHHIVFDGWSAEIVIRELNLAYNAVLNNSAPAWPPLDLDYVSYVDWELQQNLSGLDAITQELLPLPERLQLPLDFPRPATQSFAGSVLVFDLPMEQCLGLRQYAQDMGVTLFPVLVSLINTFLYRHTGQTDLVVGCPAANREHEQTQGMVGLFVNTLAIRTTLDNTKGFENLVREVQGRFQSILSTQAYPFEKVIDVLGVERDPSRNPLFDVFIAQEDASWSNYGQAPLHMQPVALQQNRSKFDLSFYFRETVQGGFEVHMEYCTELFREETIRNMSTRFMVLLDAILRKKDTPLAALEILPWGERARLESFNDTAELLDIERDVDSYFLSQVPKSSGAVAILDQTGRSCTYAEFNDAVSRLAAHLISEGLLRGDYAAICFERSLEMMISIFAVMRIGATYVPLSASLPQSRLQSICEDLGRCTIITAPVFADMFARCNQRLLTPDIQRLPIQNAEAVLPGVVADAGIAPDSVAYVIFTSGSTGRPKGVQIEHRSVCNRLLWMQSRFPIGEGDVVLQKTTVSFDVSIWELFWWSWCGAALALLEPEGEKNPAIIIEAISSRKVTVLHFVPSMLRAFLEHLEHHPEDVSRLQTLRYVFTSGEALPVDLVARFNALLHAELHNLYGPTEAAIDVTWYPCHAALRHSVPIGRPVSNTKMYVLDEQKQMVPVGVAGELYISGAQVARGYVNRQERTTQVFLNDPFYVGNRMYRTGDLGKWLPDGTIEYLGRNDDQVKIRGYRIELGEVESALSCCRGVSQAVVRVCTIGGYKALEAFVLPHATGTLSLRELRKELSGLLPEYMCPALFFEVDDIPLSPSGKADRKNIQGRPLLPESGSGGESALQGEIGNIWRQVMPEVDIRNVDQGFFEVGGNSLLLVQLHALLNERWEGIFSLASLFSASTIREQARYIEQIHSVPQVISPKAERNAPVAIIGMAVRIGDYEDTERFWEDLAAGVDKNVPLSAKRQREVRQIFETVGFAYDASKLREASYLSDISSFDYKRFGLSPSDASMLDPKQRVFLEVAMQALDDAGYGGAALENRNVGTFVGASPYRLFQDAVTRAFPGQSEQIYLLNVPSNVVARLSYLKNWSGPAATIDTACSSVLKAVHDACHSLRTGESCVTLVGGVHAIDLPLKSDTAFTIEAKSGQTRTFDAKADGVGAGEGAAVFVLKLLDQALQDNDPIHAVIIGSAVNQDGKSSSMAAPNPNAQAEVILRAAQNASISLTDVDFFEAHGTATVLGDPIEVEALGKAFAREGKQRHSKALIGSVKGNVGHLDAAAGAVGLAKAVVSLKKGFVPPQPHFESPNPHIDFDAAPVRVASSLEALSAMDKPWMCGVSSFGLSGVNAHVIVREHTSADMPADDGHWYCVPISASDEASLKDHCRRIGEVVSRNGHWPLHAIAGTLIAGREHLDARVVITANSRQAFLAQLSEEMRPVLCARSQSMGVIGAFFTEQDQAQTAADQFLRGQKLVWPEDRPLYRVHLPATPFSRTSLWPRFVSEYISQPMQTPTGTAFSLAIGRPDYWPVSEHRLQDVPTLVGMGMLDLIGKAAGAFPLSIDNLRWHRPVTFEEGNLATLFMEKNDGVFSVELHHFQKDAWNVAASAKARVEKMAPPAGMDIAGLRDSMRVFEAEGEQSLISISKRWHCREALWVADGGDRLLALISLPEEFRYDLHTFTWHPAMVDIAASLALHAVAGFVPARCGQIRLYKPLPATVYAYVVITDRQSKIITANCTVTDPSGHVLLEMTDLVFLSVQKSLSVPELYDVVWTKTDLPGHAPDPNARVMLLGSNDNSLYDRVVDATCMQRPLPEQEEGRKELAGEMLRNEITHMVYLPSAGSCPWLFCSQLQEISRAGLRKPLHITAVGCGALANYQNSPDHALVLGMLLSLKQEEPLISCSYVELASQHDAQIQAFKASLGLIDGPYMVDGNGNICTQELAKLDALTGQGISPDGCVVISGGFGGMSMTLAEQITAETGAKVVLLHRRTDGVQDSPFSAYYCDINDAGRVADVFAEIRRDIGPVQGVIHTAGVAGDGYLLSKKQAAYEAVLAPKVTGTWNLHEATLNDDLRFFVLASSRTSLVGAPGQSDYTGANAYLNAFAQYRRFRGLPALSICWNTWSGVGMAARLQADHGGYTLAPAQAFGVLDKALSSGVGLVAVAMSDEDVSRYKLAVPIAAELRQEVAPGNSAESEILEIFRDCLGYDAELTREDDFFDMGGDSISGTRVVSRIDKALGITASVVDLLESDTLGDFIDRVLADFRGGTSETHVPSGLSESPELPKSPESPETSGMPVKSAESFASATPNMSRKSAMPGIQPAPEREKYPVGSEQLAILYADLLGNGHLGYNLPAFLRLPHDLDTMRLEKSIATLMQRHEVLRTTFCDFDQEHPNMVIHPFDGFTLEVVHLPDISGKDSLITPFDLKKEAGFRIKLLVVNGAEYYLFFDIHHALADGRTISLLNAELFRLYNGQPLEPVSLQQKDFAWHQFTHLNEGDKAYWQAIFKGNLPKTDLPSDCKRPPIHTNRGGMHEFELSAELVAGIRNLARKEGVTHYNIVLSAWAFLVHAYTRSDDVVIAISVDSRNEHINTAGMLASVLPLRFSVGSGKSVGRLLKDAQKVSNDALRHRSYILNNLLTDLHLPASLDRSLLSEVILSYMNFEFAKSGGLFETLRFNKAASKTDLSVFGSDSGDRISFALEYYADMFSKENIVSMSNDFITILKSMTSGASEDPVEFTYVPQKKRSMNSVTNEIGGELFCDITQLAEARHVSVAAVMLATFAALLNRVTARNQFVIDFEAAVSIPFSIENDTEFDALLLMAHANIAGAREASPVASGAAAHDHSGGDTFMRVAFSCCEAPQYLEGLDTEYDLVCSVHHQPDGLTVRFDHSIQTLSIETARNWLGYYELFLNGIRKGTA